MTLLPPGYTRRDVATPDGRMLEVLLSGPADGRALVLHPGTPMAATPLPSFDDAAASAGFQVISYSRPGYGLSSEAPGRSVADAAADVSAILDELGAFGFVSVGLGGGGPHALACGALLPGRCRAVACVSGPAPADADGLDWSAGMAADRVEELALAMTGGAEYELMLELRSDALCAVSSSDELVEAMMSGVLSSVDRRAIRDGLWRELVAGMQRGILAGTAGWRDDHKAMTEPWGFDVAEIEVPVRVWHGDDDRIVPVSHGRWLAERAGGARFVLLEGEGNVSPLSHIGDALVADLAALIGRSTERVRLGGGLS
jgi:pimeloyl-ACP methyl ester carboxylesterase